MPNTLWQRWSISLRKPDFCKPNRCEPNKKQAHHFRLVPASYVHLRAARFTAIFERISSYEFCLRLSIQ